MTPLLSNGNPVAWWFAFKFNGATYSGDEKMEVSPGIFGGTPKDYKGGFSLTYAYASSAHAALKLGPGYLGTSLSDPLGATFNQIYNGNCNYILWNDQFDNDPMPAKSAPAGHSKGVLAWDHTGAGIVIQVTTPSWPGSGSKLHPRQTDGNTVGCINDDDVEFSQHFFALSLTEADVAAVLAGLVNASVVTMPGNRQIFNAGGPASLQAIAAKLGPVSASTSVLDQMLSSGVRLISKPSKLTAPPWQLVSAQLGGLPLRLACWWAMPDEINSTNGTVKPACWSAALGSPGAVQIATTGTWMGKSISLIGEPPDVMGLAYNHAKIGVSTLPAQPLCIFGDMNQQGSLNGTGVPGSCEVSQNGRGGMFFVMNNQTLWGSLTALLAGNSVPVA
jgi:hypothetical protein